MALQIPLHQESNLVGRIVTSAVSTTATTIYAQFEDSKTGVARTPQATTLVFTLDKDNSRFETIQASSHTTAAGVTTITVATNGRALPSFGIGAGSATGTQHPIGAQIGCVDIHKTAEVLNNWMDGTEASSANAFRVGDETDSDIYFYAENADVLKPYIFYDAGTSGWYYANDGASEIAFGGAGTITAGDGLTLLAGDMDIDTTDVTVFVDTSSGAADVGLVPILDAGGALAVGFINPSTLAGYINDVTATMDEINQALDGISADVTAVNLNTLTAGAASNADALHTHGEIGLLALTAGEAINGSVTPVAVCQGTASQKHQITVHLNGTDLAANLDWTITGIASLLFGNGDVLSKQAQSFTVTDATAEEITVENITVFLNKVGAPVDNVYITIMGDAGNTPDNTVIANGTSGTQGGGGIDLALAPYLFIFATPPTLVSGAKYWIVLNRSAALNAANYYTVAYEAADNYAGHGRASYTASITTWSAEQANDWMFHAVFNMDYGNQVFQLDSNDPQKGNYIGFTTDNVADTDPINVVPVGAVMNDFAGLTAGGTYYASNTPGAFATANPVARNVSQIVVGEARSATEMYLMPGKREWNTLVASGGAFQITATPAASLYLTVPIGFRATGSNLMLHNTISGVNYYAQADFSGTYCPIAVFGRQADGGGVDHGGYMQVAPVTATAFGGIVDTVYDNAVRLQIYCGDQNEAISAVGLFVKG